MLCIWLDRLFWSNNKTIIGLTYVCFLSHFDNDILFIHIVWITVFALYINTLLVGLKDIY